MSDTTPGPLSTSFDTTQVKTGKPIIVDGWQGKVRFAKVTETDIAQKGKMLTFEYHILTPAPTTEGKQVQPPFPLFHRITLFDKNTPPGEIPERSITNICRIQDAFLGTGDVGNNKGKPQRPPFDMACVTLMTGKEAYVKLKANLGGEFEGNDVVKLTALADMQA